ncbi:MAG: adenosylcobinamide-GDP ribazoletransferase, partial [Thaumarchaeota archaeon]|nr:adenosylcobinamide-GDP ribazoletransferase [Nitrososphaerota archaeon]
ADGLMAKGTKEKKLQAMKDLSTGSAGIVTVVLYIIGMIIALSLFEGYLLFQAILVSEIMAKFSMVLMASTGQSAALGTNSPFVQLMKDKKKLAASIALTIIPLVIVAGSIGMIVFAAGVIVTLFLVGLSTRSFGGITGDVLGASNEFTRLTSLLIFVTI